ncbi:DUF6882 domain-containing protein [Chishuiella sp.]|uniref:DUF6882 domain-containing protein n=1 Tax=Chishuiella sp. TaxID=1969467 RepID=UPI0028ADF2FD|nr:DUF6882 domain-containing protein [Chishuiella sp.]
MLDYNEYSQSELNKLIPIQDEFKEKYKIDSFSHWFYDDDLKIIRLYNDDKHEIFFKYIPIGTYSLTSETWMWSWFNNDENNAETVKIKNFGLENNYRKLYEGTFPSDIYDGWEFLAISFNILDGIGVYTLNTENLNYYLLLIENLNSEKDSNIKILKQQVLDCPNHGLQRKAFVCQHLNLEKPVGFIEAFDTYPKMELEEEDLQAWCNDCENIRRKHNGWNEESEPYAQIKLICENCYFEIKNINQ